MKLLNLGCGINYHPLWINIDFVSTGPDVMAHNLLSGIPFPDHSFDVVYHSHVLEHFSREDAQDFIAECYRVLKPGGLLRVAVPDLEEIVKCYLSKLEECLTNKSGDKDDYDWILLELFDQIVRNTSGGEMAKFMESLDVNKRRFALSRIGTEAEKFWKPKQTLSSWCRIAALVKRTSWKTLFKLLREKIAGWLVYLIAGKATYMSFKIGIFRSSGEVHQWMYDRYSLKRLLEQAGFVNVKVCAATESSIPEYEKYSLDVLNGVVRKPDSLYVEATKP